MADSAKLVIEIDEGTGGSPGTGTGSGTGAGGVSVDSAAFQANWKAMLAEMDKTLADSAARIRGLGVNGTGSGTGTGGGRPSPGTSVFTAEEWRTKVRENQARQRAIIDPNRDPDAAFTAAEWKASARKSFDRGREMARIAAKANKKRLKDMADAEKDRDRKAADARKAWMELGKKSAKRGREMAKMSAKANKLRLKQKEEAERPVREAVEAERRKREARVARGKAWRKAKTYKRRAEAIYKGKAVGLAKAGAAGIAARAVMSNAPGKYESAGKSVGAIAGGTLGAAYGPAGAAVGAAVGEKAGEKVGARLDDPFLELTATAKFAGRAFDEMGAAAAKVSRNDGFGTFQHALGLATEGLEQIPVVGKSTAEVLRTVGKAFTMVKETADAFSARGRELSGYNGSIAVAAAQQDVTRMLTDIREAEMMGDKYARLIDAQTRFEETLKAGLLPIKEVIVERIPPFLDAILSTIDLLIQIGYAIPGVKDDLIDKILTGMRDIREDLSDDRRLKADVMVRRWLGDGELGPRPPIGERPLGGPLGVPIVLPP